MSTVCVGFHHSSQLQFIKIHKYESTVQTLKAQPLV